MLFIGCFLAIYRLSNYVHNFKIAKEILIIIPTTNSNIPIKKFISEILTLYRELSVIYSLIIFILVMLLVVLWMRDYLFCFSLGLMLAWVDHLRMKKETRLYGIHIYDKK